jgi:large subunit ribosomal protein L35
MSLLRIPRPSSHRPFTQISAPGAGRSRSLGVRFSVHLRRPTRSLSWRLFKPGPMPKMKSNSGAKKRFVLTASGRVKRKQAFKRHILTKKSPKTKRQLGQTALVAPVDEARVKRMIAA